MGRHAEMVGVQPEADDPCYRCRDWADARSACLETLKEANPKAGSRPVAMTTAGADRRREQSPEVECLKLQINSPFSSLFKILGECDHSDEN